MKIDRLIAEARGLPWHHEKANGVDYVISDDPRGWEIIGISAADQSDKANLALIVHMSKVALLYRELVTLPDWCDGDPSGADGKLLLAGILTRIEELEHE